MVLQAGTAMIVSRQPAPVRLFSAYTDFIAILSTISVQLLDGHDDKLQIVEGGYD